MVGLFLSALYIYLQLLVWKRHGDDLMLIAANIVAVFLFWAALITAIVRQWRTTNAKNAAVGTPDQKRIVIHSAVYGTDHSNDVSVTDKLNRAVTSALVMPVTNKLVPRDPLEGTIKRLLVDYSYGDSEIRQIVKREYELLILPEDSQVQHVIESELKAKDTAIQNAIASKTATPESIAFAEEQKFVDELRRMTPEEMRVKMRDPQFVQRVEAIPRNKYRALPTFPELPERYIDTLEKRAFAVAREVRALLSRHGKEPELGTSAVPGDEPLDRMKKHLLPWRERVTAGYNAHLANEVRQIRDELAERGLSDGDLNELVAKNIKTEKDLSSIAQKIRILTSQLED
jgi:hypothetical protein